MSNQYFLPDGSVVSESGSGLQYFLPDGAVVNESAALAVAGITTDHDLPISWGSYVGSASPKQYFLPSGDVVNDPGTGSNYFFGESVMNGGGVVVAQSTTAISVSPTSATIARGATQTFTVIDQSGITRTGVTVASSDISVATVSTPNNSLGISVATASGSTSGLTTLTFTFNNGTSNLTTTATLSVQSVATISGNGAIPLTGTVVTFDHDLPITYKGYISSTHDMPISTQSYVAGLLDAEFDFPISIVGDLAFDFIFPISWGQSISIDFDFPISTGITTFTPDNRHIFDIIPRA